MFDFRRTPFHKKSPRNQARSFSTWLIWLFLFCSQIIATGTALCFKAAAETRTERTCNVDAPCKVTSGSSITQDISGGNSHAYQIQLNARQYLRFLINKGDLKLSVTFYGSNGEPLFEYVDRYYGVLDISLVVDLQGTYRLEVRSLESEPASKNYELKIEQVRSATARDVKEAAALKVFATANNLRAEWDESSLRNALEKFTRAWLMWVSANQPRKAIKALMSAAEVHFTLGEYRQALSLYKRALVENRRISDYQGELESINQLGRVYSYLGDNDEADRYLTSVLHYYEQQGHAPQSIDDKRLNAEALSNLAEVSYSKGNLIRAIELINRSLAIWVDVADRRGEAQARLILGYALTSSGDHEKALAQFNQAMALYHAVEDRKGEALSLTAIGSLHSLSGEEQLAIDSHLEAMTIFRRIGDHQSEAVTLNGVGQTYEDLNERLTALDNYKQALKLFERNESLDFAAGTEYEIARLYRLMNDNQQALTHYNRCISLSRRTKKRRTEAYALNDIASIYDSQARRGETLHQYNKILKLYNNMGDLRGQAITFTSIGDLFFAMGDKQKALGFYKQALPLIQASGDREGETSILYNIARAERDQGALDEALAQIEQSLQIIETLRSYVAGPALRSSYFASVHKHYELYIDLLMQLEQQRPGQGFGAMALRASESSRARSFLETLGEVNVNIRRGVNQELLEREQQLEQLLNAKAKYQIELSSAKQTQAEAAEVAREIRQLTSEYQVVEAQLREQSPQYASLKHPMPLNLREIQAEIRDENTLLLEYFLGDEKSYLWVVSPDSFYSYDLPPRTTLEDAAREVYSLLTARQQIGERMDADYQERVTAADAQYDEKAMALSRMLLGPVASRLGNKRLLIVTEGALQYIPFDALPMPDTEPTGEPATAASGLSSSVSPPLVLQHEIVNLPSISTLAVIRSERSLRDSPSKVVAILADPVFEIDDPRVQKSNDLVAGGATIGTQPAETQRTLRDFEEFTGNSRIPRLPYTLQEAEAISAVTPSDGRMVATGFGASRETVINSELSQYQVVHFATHGLIDDEHPELSGIFLSLVNKNGQQERGFLQLHDIYNLNLSAKLVVLSACRTGLGRDIRGEGLVGLARGFMYAGSKSIVASLWKVDDRATAELMGYFYKAMLKGNLPPAAALQLAKNSLRTQHQWRAPYFWAAFVLQGEYRESVQITDTKRKPSYVIASVAALICLLCLLYFKRRRTAHS